jgi:hypothetical protein
MKSKLLIIREMSVIFNKQIQVLQKKTPNDAAFRKSVIGVPFWAEAQKYKFTPTGIYAGVVLHYKIKRGGVTPCDQ